MKSSTIRRSTLSRETMEVIENLAKDQDSNGLPNEYVRPEDIETPKSENDSKAQEIDLLWQTFKTTQFNTKSPLAYMTGGFLVGVIATILVLVCVGAIAVKTDSKLPKKTLFGLEKLFVKKAPEQTLEQQTDRAKDTADMQVSIPNEEENVSSTPENASGSAEVAKGVKEFKKYIVQSGDTGESIIKHYYGSWSQEKADLVMKANNLTNFDKINIGQELIIPIQE